MGHRFWVPLQQWTNKQHIIVGYMTNHMVHIMARVARPVNTESMHDTFREFCMPPCSVLELCPRSFDVFLQVL